MSTSNQGKVAPRLIIPGLPMNKHSFTPTFAPSVPTSNVTQHGHNTIYRGFHSGPSNSQAGGNSDLLQPNIIGTQVGDVSGSLSAWAIPKIKREPVPHVRRVTLQVVRHNNNRGSFNTMMMIPVEGFPTLHSLKTKLTTMAQSHGMDVFITYFRYGSRGTKYIIETEDAFDEIDWSDERLVFNIEEINVKKTGSNDQKECAKEKRETKYQKQNKVIEEAKEKLRKNIPIELQRKMTHRHWVQMSYLHAFKPDEYPIAEIIKRVDMNSSQSTKSLQAPGVNDNGMQGKNNTVNTGDSTQVNILLAIQSSLTRLEDRIIKCESKMQ